ncbi:hypothetical protein [Halorussus halophilus]|uniref:hypothetical protein n=1 Tax=Halorussus halophilus TaxID=2650975 RepID=UPI001300D603|nr:hypothetical protein [Halorussus halophilus]
MANIDAEMEKSRKEVAEYLREFAEELEPAETPPTPTNRPTDEAESDTAREDEAETPSGEKVTLLVGNESATINPPGTVDFDVSVDSDAALVGSSETQHVSFQLTWEGEEVETDDELRVE